MDNEINKKLFWSKASDVLFKSDVDWWHNASIDHCDYSYAEGFKLAADLLIKHIKNDRSDNDFLVYPIIFSYRHYIELTLKSIILDGCRLDDIHIEIGNKKDKIFQLLISHNISKLWEKASELIKKLFPEEPTEDLEAMNLYIRQFSDLDPDSQAFRYSTMNYEIE